MSFKKKLGNILESVAAYGPAINALSGGKIAGQLGDVGNLIEAFGGQRENVISGQGGMVDAVVRTLIASGLDTKTALERAPKVLAAELIKKQLGGKSPEISKIADAVVKSGGNDGIAMGQAILSQFTPKPKPVEESVKPPANLPNQKGTPINPIGQTGNMFQMLEADLMQKNADGSKSLRPVDERQLTYSNFLQGGGMTGDEYNRYLTLLNEKNSLESRQGESGVFGDLWTNRLKAIDQELSGLTNKATEATENYTTRVLDVFGNPAGGKYDGRYFDDIAGNKNLAFDPQRGVVPKSDQSPLDGIYGGVPATTVKPQQPAQNTNNFGSGNGLNNFLDNGGASLAAGLLTGLLGDLFKGDEKQPSAPVAPAPVVTQPNPNPNTGGIGTGLPTYQSYFNSLGLADQRGAQDYIQAWNKHKLNNGVG